MRLQLSKSRWSGFSAVAAVLAVMMALLLAGSPGVAADKTGEDETADPAWLNAAYIKFDGIDGEAQDKDHKGWSDLLSFSQSIHTPQGTGAGAAARRSGDVVLEDILVVKELDKASPKLAEAIATGKVIPTVKIELTVLPPELTKELERVPYFVYELRNVQITSYNISGTSGSGERPMEELSLNFEEIKVTYTEVATGDSEEFSWNVSAGRR